MLGVQSLGVGAAAEQLRRIDRGRAVSEQRRTEWVRRQDTEYKTDVLAARSEMQRLEEAFRRVDMERKAVDAATANASASLAGDAAGKRRDPALRCAAMVTGWCAYGRLVSLSFIECRA